MYNMAATGVAPGKAWVLTAAWHIYLVDPQQERMGGTHLHCGTS